MTIRKEAKKPTISPSEITQAREDAEYAKKIFEEPEFKFVRDFLVKEKERIIDNAVNNRLKKMSSKEGLELEVEESGKFKFIFDFTNYLQVIMNRPAEIEKAIKEKRLEVEGETDG